MAQEHASGLSAHPRTIRRRHPRAQQAVLVFKVEWQWVRQAGAIRQNGSGVSRLANMAVPVPAVTEEMVGW